MTSPCTRAGCSGLCRANGLMTSLIRSGSSTRILPASYCGAVPLIPTSLLQSTRANDLGDNKCDFRTVNTSLPIAPSALPESQTSGLGTHPHITCADRQRIRTPDFNHLDRYDLKTIYRRTSRPE